MRLSVSTVDFRIGALGFSVFVALCGLYFFPVCKIWWHLLLEQIIQTLMEQHQLLVFFLFVLILALFYTFVTSRFLIMKKILDRRPKVCPEALSTPKGSFFHVSLPHFDCK